MVDAHVEAERIVADARAWAAEIVEEARAKVAEAAAGAAREAREREIARVTAEVLVVRAGDERHRERAIDRTIELAVLLAERLVGEALAVEPERLSALAAQALRETRGARQIRVEAAAEDVAALQALLRELGEGVVSVEPSSELGRGSLLVHTELGRVDARLAPQLARLADALREHLSAADADAAQGSG
jgi:flagellar biosynthesis/type III secretory pathway protein FliH